MNVQHKSAIFSRRGLLFALARSAVLRPSPNHRSPAPAAPPRYRHPAAALPAEPVPHRQPKPRPKSRPSRPSSSSRWSTSCIKFSSDETGLPIKSTVKRQLTTRDAVEKYLEEKFNEDEGAKRLQRDEIVLKKFGLLDHDFDLKPFLLALLKEQIEAYYDSKTKTVNLLDWVGADEQKPVLAHELTHALQDQHSDLEKWNDQTPDDVSTDCRRRPRIISPKTRWTPRATPWPRARPPPSCWITFSSRMGKSLIKDPEVLDLVKQQMSGSEDSPVMARAPLLLSESMLFPYREGLSFEQDVWMDQGQTAAFAGALDRPPTSSWEIINPREYEKKHIPAVPLLPDIHPARRSAYKPYDIGQVGQLDVHILSELLGGDNAARDLTPAWNGGLYWAGQLRSATTPAQQARYRSIGLFYLSVWKNADSAQVFARIYANNLGAQVFPAFSQITSSSTSAAGRRRGGTGLHHQRRPGRDHHSRQNGLRRRELPAAAGAQAHHAHPRRAGHRRDAHG